MGRPLGAVVDRTKGTQSSDKIVVMHDEVKEKKTN